MIKFPMDHCLHIVYLTFSVHLTLVIYIILISGVFLISRELRITVYWNNALYAYMCYNYYIFFDF